LQKDTDEWTNLVELNILIMPPQKLAIIENQTEEDWELSYN
jgi:hypothetical protein